MPNVIRWISDHHHDWRVFFALDPFSVLFDEQGELLALSQFEGIGKTNALEWLVLAHFVIVFVFDVERGNVVGQQHDFVAEEVVFILIFQFAARDVVALVTNDAVKRGVLLESSVPDNLPRVRADRVQLSQVLLNLVLNAMDAVSAAPSAERRVRVAAKLTGPRTVEVSVVDSGHGIAADMLDRVFEPFVTTKPTGLGIGLAVARAIIDTHGGRLWAENNAHGGATFRFELSARG